MLETLGGYAVSIVSNLFGYTAVAAKLRGKLDTTIYQAGTKDKWDAHNALRDRVTKIESRIDQLDKQNGELRDELRQLRALLVEKALK